MNKTELYRATSALGPMARRKWLRKQLYPKLLFKYFPIQPTPEITKERFGQLFVTSDLWLSALDDFNDPFDARLNVVTKASPDRLKWALRNLINASPLPPGISRPTGADLEVLVDRMALEGTAIKSAQRGYDRALSEVGICCFASDARNILMWSHYASNHKGICAVFRPDAGIDPLIEALRVEYSEEYPKYDYVEDDDNTLAKRGLLRKYKDWEYEGERRIIRLNSARQFIRFRPESLVAVIVGCQASDASINLINELRAERKAASLPNVKLLFANKHVEKYEVVIKSRR